MAIQIPPSHVKLKRPKQSEIERPDLSPHDRRRKLRPEKYLTSLAYQRAKARNIEFSISADDIIIPKTCPLLGIPLDQFHPNIDFHCSLDRIDPIKGYIKGNVMVISHRANRIKSDATPEELLIIATNLKNIVDSL